MQVYPYLALVLSSIAIVVSVFSFLKTRRVTFYQDIDRLYMEVLKMGMEHPRFLDHELTRNYKKSFTGEELGKYNAYAFIVWNVCETISDRMNDKTLFMKDKSLSDTWEPVLMNENRLHRVWFDDVENVSKFKCEFRSFIRQNYPAEISDAPAQKRLNASEKGRR